MNLARSHGHALMTHFVYLVDEVDQMIELLEIEFGRGRSNQSEQMIDSHQRTAMLEHA